MTELLVCSNRGPYTYERPGERSGERSAGGFVGHRGGGGLIGAIAPVMEQLGGTWIASALGPVDRELARAQPEGRDEHGFRLQLLDIPEALHDLHYNVVSNEYLWFLFHYLLDTATEPSFGRSFARAWEAYEAVNRLYADAVAAAPGPGAVLVEDYHLMLVGEELRRRGERRPLCYFHHTPWCEPDYLSILPEGLVGRILTGLLAYDAVGFHSHRWARSFLACCRRFLPDARVGDDVVSWRGRSTRVTTAPVPVDADRLSEQAGTEQTLGWLDWVKRVRGDRRLLIRVDRMDLSKNSLRGFLAFEELLERRPELARDTLFLALQYPSRLGVERYRRYFAQCLDVVARVNERFAAAAPGDEGPLGLHFQDEFSRSLAAMRIHDAILVNSTYDGMNLVAKESAAVNERDGVIILSRNTGAFEEIGSAVEDVNPFDVTGTADAMERAIELPVAERRQRAADARHLSVRTTPQDWARTRLAAAGISL